MGKKQGWCLDEVGRHVQEIQMQEKRRNRTRPTLTPNTYLLMPHINADSERVFSMVNKICIEHRADLAQDTVAALLPVKVNSRVDPQRFEPSRNELGLGKAKSAAMEYNRLHLHPA